MKVKQYIAALLLVTTVGVVLTSCKTTEKPVEANTDATVTSETAAENTAQTTTARQEPKLPDIRFDGADYNVIGHSLWGYHYFGADAENGDPVNDALYARNSKISEKYDVNISFKEVSVKDTSSLTSKSVLSGDGTYSLILPTLGGAATLMNSGYLTALSDTEYLELDMPWWSADSVKCLSLGSNVFFAVNSINLLNYNTTSAAFFNKNMIKDLSLESPYELVHDNEWTFERMFSMGRAASSDLNGDGVMDDTDRYGVLTSATGLTESMLSCGEPLIRKDGDDYPYLALESERSAAVFDYLLKSITDESVLKVNKYSGKYKDAWKDLMYPAFKEGRGLFTLGMLQYVFFFRDSDVDYGIVPRPKYDSAQEQYYSQVNWYWANCTAIPAVVADIKMSQIVLEALCAESLYSVTPVNIEIAIINKQLHDATSAEMIEIAAASRYFDMGQFMGFTGINSALVAMVDTGTNKFASARAAEESSARANIDSFIEKYLEVNK